MWAGDALEYVKPMTKPTPRYTGAPSTTRDGRSKVSSVTVTVFQEPDPRKKVPEFIRIIPEGAMKGSGDGAEMLRNGAERRERLIEVMARALSVPRCDIGDFTPEISPRMVSQAHFLLYNHGARRARLVLTECKSFEFEEAVQDLLLVLQRSYQFCAMTSYKQIEDAVNVHESLRLPVSKGDEMHPRFKETLEAHRNNTFLEMFDILKQNAVEWFRNNCDAGIWNTFVCPEIATEACASYFEGCILLCWMMHCQFPPMCLGEDKEGDKFTEDYEVFGKKTGKKIKLVVWPPLYWHKDGPVLRKGKAKAKSTNVFTEFFKGSD